MTKISPIAEYLRLNKAITKKDKNGCHFIGSDGLYLGRLTKAFVNNYRVINIELFGEGLKKMYTKSVAIGQQYAYIKNISSPMGVSLIPVKTYKRKIFVDFISRTSVLQDSEKTLTNKLDLIAVDEATKVGLYDIDKPFMYSDRLTNHQHKTLTGDKFIHTVN